jgi:NTE family protein
MGTPYMIRRKKQPSKIVGIALSGGSTWGIAHVGVLEALVESGIPIHRIAGTSAGAVVAACFAFGMSMEKMVEATSTVSWKKLSKFSYSRLGLRSNTPMREFLTDLLGDVRIETSEVPLAIVAADIETHEKVVLREGSVHDAVRASTAIPGLFRPVELEGRLLVDGAITENVPVPTVRDMGADIVIGVNLFAQSTRRRPKSVIGVLRSSATALSYHHDNTLARSADVLIEPDLSGFNAFAFTDADKMRAAGYAAGLAAVPRIQELLGLEKKVGLRSRIQALLNGVH